jgi:hypothetical protein
MQKTWNFANISVACINYNHYSEVNTFVVCLLIHIKTPVWHEGISVGLIFVGKIFRDTVETKYIPQQKSGSSLPSVIALIPQQMTSAIFRQRCATLRPRSYG